MTLHDPTAPLHAGARRALRFAPALFAATLFVSALLLFAVQPMFTKMVLPMLGGAPSVWSVAMVFFQAALLVGYAYAHLLARTLPRRAGGAGASRRARRRRAHAADRDRARLRRAAVDGVGLWLVGLFAASIGLPFVALSASAPLLQSWFAASGHPQARNPYVLYAASNLGSFAALLAYPLAIESLLTLARAGLDLVGRLCRACGAHRRRRDGRRARGRTALRCARATRPSAADVRERLSLDRARRHSGRPRDRGDGLHLDRRRGGAVALGAAARALSAHLRGGVSRQAVVLARARRHGSCRSSWRRSRSRCSAATASTGSPPSALNLLALFVLALACHGEVYAGGRRPRC